MIKEELNGLSTSRNTSTFFSFFFWPSIYHLAESSRGDLGPITVAVREVSPTTSPGNGPGLLTTAAVTEPTPPAEPANATSSPAHHHHFQGNWLCLTCIRMWPQPKANFLIRSRSSSSSSWCAKSAFWLVIRSSGASVVVVQPAVPAGPAGLARSSPAHGAPASPEARYKARRTPEVAWIKWKSRRQFEGRTSPGGGEARRAWKIKGHGQSRRQHRGGRRVGS